MSLVRAQQGEPSLLHDVEHTLKPLDFQGVSVFFAHLSKFTFQGKQFVVFSV